MLGGAWGMLGGFLGALEHNAEGQTDQHDSHDPQHLHKNAFSQKLFFREALKKKFDICQTPLPPPPVTNNKKNK